MSTEMQTKVQASPVQNFTPVQTGLLQRKSALCNTPVLVEDSGQDKEKLTLQRSSADQAGTTMVPRFGHEVLQSPGQPLDPETRAFMERRFGHDFSRVSILGDAPVMIQAKLTISQPNDRYEQEADRVAEQAMRMPEPEVYPKSTRPLSQGPSCGDEEMEGKLIQTMPIAEEITTLIQRRPEEEEKKPIEELKEEEEPIMTKALSGKLQVTDSLGARNRRNSREQQLEEPPIDLSYPLDSINTAIRSRINSERGRGTPLPALLKPPYDQHNGMNMSNVRIHSNDAAEGLTQWLNAEGFTIGHDIFINPKADNKPSILSHELSHVAENSTSIIQLWPRGRRGTLADYIVEVRQVIGPGRSASINNINLVLSPLERARIQGQGNWTDVEAFFASYHNLPASRQNGAAGLTVFLRDLAESLIRGASQNQRAIVLGDYRRIAMVYDAHFGLNLINDVLRIFNVEWRRLVILQPQQARVSMFTQQWRQFWRSRINTVASTPRGIHLMRWVLDVWTVITNPQNRNYRAMQQLGWQINTSGGGAWYQSLDVVDPALAGQQGSHVNTAIRNFWQTYVFHRFNRALDRTYARIIDIHTVLNSYVYGQTGTVEELEEEITTSLTTNLQDMGQDLDNWLVLTYSLHPNSDLPRIERYRRLYNRFWNARQALATDDPRMTRAGYSQTAGGRPIVQPFGWVTTAP